MGSSRHTFVPKQCTTVFKVKNIAPGNKKIKIFTLPIPNGMERDLMDIPEISEADIRHSLLKGELNVKIRADEIIVTESSIDLLQFDECQKQFLEDAGIMRGLEVATSGNGGGGDGYASLEETLLVGNETNGSDIIITAGDEITGSDGSVTINGITNYGAAAVDPAVPPPSAGDMYYNTILNEEMRYDSSRGKWLTTMSHNVQAGRNGNTNPGVFYRGVNGMVLNAGDRGLPVFRGTLTSVSIARTDSDAATLEVLVNGVVIATLAHSASGFTSSDFNVDFNDGLMSFRNQAGGSQTSNTQINITYKRRT